MLRMSCLGMIVGSSGKPRKEVWKSLKVTSYIEAKRKLPLVLANLEAEFSELRSAKTISLVDFKDLVPEGKPQIENIIAKIGKPPALLGKTLKVLLIMRSSTVQKLNAA